MSIEGTRRIQQSAQPGPLFIAQEFGGASTGTVLLARRYFKRGRFAYVEPVLPPCSRELAERLMVAEAEADGAAALSAPAWRKHVYSDDCLCQLCSRDRGEL